MELLPFTLKSTPAALFRASFRNLLKCAVASISSSVLANQIREEVLSASSVSPNHCCSGEEVGIQKRMKTKAALVTRGSSTFCPDLIYHMLPPNIRKLTTSPWESQVLLRGGCLLFVLASALGKQDPCASLLSFPQQPLHSLGLQKEPKARKAVILHPLFGIGHCILCMCPA